MNVLEKRRNLLRRKARVRIAVRGTVLRPRLSVFRSNTQLYAQIIDDTDGRTIVSASSCDPGLRGQLKSGGNIEAAKQVGLLLAERAKGIPVEKVVFDRGGRLFHGRVKALADAVRSGGLAF